MSFLSILKALFFSSITNYEYASTLLNLIFNKTERIKNFFIRTDDFKIIEFLYYISKGSIINYFMNSKNIDNFGEKYLRFHYRLIKNKQQNVFKPYIDVKLNKKINNNDLILFKNSIPNIFINLKPNNSLLKKKVNKNSFQINNPPFKFNLTNLLIYFVCLVNNLNAIIQNLYYQLKKLIKFFFKN